jgi:enoyl-CoA hydratase
MSAAAETPNAWSTACFDVAIEGHVAHVTFNRPQAMNTMIPEFWREFPEIIRDIDDNARARVIVISSTGKHFCAGMDLTVFSGGTSGAAQKEERGRAGAGMYRAVKEIQKTFNILEEARIPVIAAIQGGCVGGGVDLSAACDIRYCSADAFFVVQEINIGMTADVGTFPRLCQLIPQGWVRELAYTGRRLPAEQALKIGLVNAVLPDHEALVAHALATAHEIAQKSPLAVHGSKVMINHARDHSIADGLDYIALWQAGMYNPETDMREAMEARAQKRATNFLDLPPVRKGLGG